MSLSARILTLLALLAFWTLNVSPVGAQYRHRIVLLSREGEDADTVSAELRARLRGELAAIGFDVSIVAPPEDTDVRDAVESAARELSPSAVIGVREVTGASPGPAALEVWISDRLSGRTFVERAAPEDVRARRVGPLAVEVAESFKARLSSLRVESTNTAENEPVEEPVVPREPEVAPSEPFQRESRARAPGGGELLFGAGFGVIRQLDDAVDAWFPALQFGVGSASDGPIALAVRANVGLTPSSNEFMLAGARARTTQGWAFAQGLVRVAPLSRVEFALSLGGGVYSVGVEGDADAPDTANQERTWSPAATVGLGAWIETSDSLIVALEGQGLTAWSKTVVRIKGEDVAAFGFPAGIFSASLIGRY